MTTPLAMKPEHRVLTGIRATGSIHLGNLLGAIQPALQRQGQCKTFFFIADLHGLTVLPDKGLLRTYTHQLAAAWLAAGLDPNQSIIWRQSDLAEHIELSYFLACPTTMGLLERAHTYKDAIAKEQVVKMGLFYYPLLMASDILLFDSDFVPVGEDQQQHLEMTRDIATFFNERYGPTFKLPREIVVKTVATVPGVDGRKMSKSYHNGLDIFGNEALLKKQVMSIQTDSKTLAEPKVAEDCLVFKLFRLVAAPEETSRMKEQLEAGGYGYGDAKKTLFSCLMDRYGAMRQSYAHWIKDPTALEDVLQRGAEKARVDARKMMQTVRDRVGL